MIEIQSKMDLEIQHRKSIEDELHKTKEHGERRPRSVDATAMLKLQKELLAGPKRGIYVCKRAMYVYKRGLQQRKRSATKAYMYANELYVSLASNGVWTRAWCSNCKRNDW
jgi:hypothetical protein